MVRANVQAMFHYGLRWLWFPEWNHDESNVASNVPNVVGLGPAMEKLAFLGRHDHGPSTRKSRSHWRARQKATWALLRNRAETQGDAVYDCFSLYLPAICKSMGVAADAPNARARAINKCNRILQRKQKEPNSVRWYAADDSNKVIVREQTARLFHADATLIMNNASPYGVIVDPDATLDDMMAILKQSEAVAAAILRQDKIFVVIDVCKLINKLYLFILDTCK